LLQVAHQGLYLVATQQPHGSTIGQNHI
jgi:hypothetical protein